MTKYISAYDLQQRDGLTRQQVIELAEKGPAFWKDGKKFFPDGYQISMKYISKAWFDKLGMIGEYAEQEAKDATFYKWLHNFKKDAIQKYTPNATEYLMYALSPLSQGSPISPSNPKFTKIFSLLRLNASESKRGIVTIEAKDCEFQEDMMYSIWEYLRENNNDPILDTFFKLYFKNNLFFDETNLPKNGVKNREEEILLAIRGTKRVASALPGESPRNRVTRTLAMNATTMQDIQGLLSKGISREEIAQRLKENGTGVKVIGCLLAEDPTTKPSNVKDSALSAGKRLLGQK